MRLLKSSEIRTLRMKLGMTQSALAEIAGVTQAYIAKIEAGTVDPRVSTLEKIVKALTKLTSEGNITAEQIMATPIIWVQPNDKIEKAVRLMETYSISQLPVLDGHVQIGSVSEATIVRKITEGEDMSRLVRRAVQDVMDGPFPTVGKDTVIDIINHMLEHGPAVLIVDRGKAVGIVTKADVLKLLGEVSKIRGP